MLVPLFLPTRTISLLSHCSYLNSRHDVAREICVSLDHEPAVLFGSSLCRHSGWALCFFPTVFHSHVEACAWSRRLSRQETSIAEAVYSCNTLRVRACVPANCRRRATVHMPFVPFLSRFIYLHCDLGYKTCDDFTLLVPSPERTHNIGTIRARARYNEPNHKRRRLCAFLSLIDVPNSRPSATTSD
jgi:hypothetical protein